MRHVKKMTLVAALTVLATASIAASASAAEWSSTGFTKVSGTLTLKKAGASPVECTIPSTLSNVSAALSHGSLFGPRTVTCSNGLSWTWDDWGYAVAEGGKFRICCHGAPQFGSGYAVPWAEKTYRNGGPMGEATWVNGSGSSHSYVQFTETVIGITEQSENITATGKLQIEKSNGALLTIVP